MEIWTITRDSLLGMEIADSLESAHRAAEDEEGYTDYQELDYQLQQHDEWRERLEADAQLAEVYAEEIRRFAA